MAEPSAPGARPSEPGEAVLRVVAFLVVLTIYVSVLIAISWLLPYGVLIGLAVWMVVRRPLAHPGRLEADLRAFGCMLGEFGEKLARSLLHPLSR